jgi:hypothetical protein
VALILGNSVEPKNQYITLKLDLMKKIFSSPCFFILLVSQLKTVIPAWAPYDETEELAKNATNASPRMQYKLIQSKF